jgi:N,N'-diacetyllegionaminate synthase
MSTSSEVICIAEVGSNFNNDLEIAKTYIQVASEAGADAVKFQSLRKDSIISRITRVGGRNVAYPVYDIFSSSELPDEWHYELKKEADSVGIEFLSTPFYIQAVDLLVNVGVQTFKIASGDITFYPLLERIGRTGKNVILSTGASTNEEVRKALDLLGSSGAGKITLLHCVANYPPEWHEMNLKAIPVMAKDFSVPVGLSDHTPGAMAALAAVALGATVIEKHITLDKNAAGPDHSFAMSVDEFRDMVSQIRLLEKALGDGKKEPSPGERPRVKRIRRGLYDINTGLPTDHTDNAIWLRPEHDVDF